MTQESNGLLSIQNQVNKTIDRIGFGRYQIYMISCFLVINLSLGRDNSTSTLVIFILEGEWNLSSYQVSILGGASLLGMAIGFILSLSLENKYGRLICIKCSFIMMILFECASGFMVQMWGFAVLRVLVGIANGLYYGFIFSLAVEQTPSKNRGQASLLISSGGFIGFFLVLVVVLIFIPDLQGQFWRSVILLPLLILIPFIPVLFIFVVESPLYLIRKGEYQKAIKNLNWIAKTNQQPQLTENEIQQIKNMPLVEFSPLKERIKTFFDQKIIKTTLKTFSVVPSIFFIYFGIIFHLPYLFDDEGAQTEYIVLYYLGLTALTVVLFFTILAIIEKKTFGRKKIMITLLIGVFVMIGVSLFVGDIYWISSLLILAASMTAVASGISLVITVEAFECNHRATALILVNCIARFISSTALYLLLLLLAIDYWAPLLFLECILLFIIVASFTIEDKTGVTLDTARHERKNSG